MTRADDRGARAPHELPIVRVFNAPRDLVFRSWIEPEEVRTWFAPDGFTVTLCEIDARPGGRWRVEYRSDSGGAHAEHGEFREVAGPERLVFSLTQEDDRGHSGPRTLVTVTFAQRGAKTEMTFIQTGFDSAARRDDNAEGWNECFRKLDQRLPVSERAAEREIRDLFEAWWRDAAAKDIDAVMKPIASDALSYEHEAPLQHAGVGAIRKVCQRGFDAAQGELRWDIPDLQVVVRDDIAVTWGLNRMQVQQPGEEKLESWSRGTRVFQKINGEWKMIHQHVSYPCDPATGEAKTDLAP